MAKKENGKGAKVPILFNGKPFDPNTPSLVVLRIKEKLDSMQKKGVFSAAELHIAGISAAKSTITKFVNNPSYRHYWHRFSGKNGNELAIGHPDEVKRFVLCLKEAGKE